MSLQQISTPPQSLAEQVVNRNMETLEHQAVYGQRQSAHSGLTWAYYGGRWGGTSVADGTVSLTGSNTNYLVVNRSTAALSSSTATTNWNDTTNYARVYKITTGVSAVTAVEDHRAGPNGVHGGGGGAGGSALHGLSFTSDVDSTADSDPGNGLFKWNNATQGSATTLYIDNQTADGVSLTSFYGSLAASGFVYVEQGDDSTRWQLWKWTAAPIDGTGYRKFTVTLQAKSTSDIQDAKICSFDFANDAAGSAGTAGKHAVYIAAAAMTPSASGGCAALATIATSANRPDIQSLDFDATSAEYAQFSIVMPKSWNEGTVTFRAHWSHASTTVNFGVAWELQAVAVGDDETIDAAYGTAATVTDTGGTTRDLYTTAESSAITVAGTPAAEDMVFFRVARAPGNGSDTMAIDARLHGVTVYMTTHAETDA